MYSKDVFIGSFADNVYFWNGTELCYGEPWNYWRDLGGGYVHIDVLGIVLNESERSNEVAQRIASLWHLGVMMILGLVGATVGIGIGRACRRFRQRVIVPDTRLWLLISVAAFATLLRLGVPGEHWSLWKQAVYEGDHPGDSLQKWQLTNQFWWLVRESARLLVPALVIGWAVHVILIAWGVRLPRRRLPEQAADYDDRIRSTAADM